MFLLQHVRKVLFLIRKAHIQKTNQISKLNIIKEFKIMTPIKQKIS